MSTRIKNEEQALFDEWREHCRSHAQDGFVADGVVDEAAYFGGQQKILFVLKDPNGDLADYDNDLCEFIRRGARAQTFDNLTRWVMGIRGLPEQTSWEKLPPFDKEASDTRAEVLRSVAFMNLKKEPGKPEAKDPELWVAANRDRRYIQRQFSLYDPDITICCGTGGHFVETALGHPKSIWKHTSDKIGFFERESGKFIVDYGHPQPRYAPEKLYSQLMSALHEIL